MKREGADETKQQQCTMGQTHDAARRGGAFVQSFSIASFSYFFFITLTSREIWPEDSQPSGNAATI